MKKIILLLSLFVFIFSSCKEEVDCPKLKIVNDNPYYSVLAVSLVGYKFTNLRIEKGTSKTFELNHGIAGGYKDVNVTVCYGTPQMASWEVSKTYDFKDGKTTVVTVVFGKLE